MFLAALVMTFAQMLDLTTFVRMIQVHGPASEANPLVAGLLLGHGLPFVAAAKIAGLSLAVAAIAVLAGRGAAVKSPRLAALVAAAAIVAGIVGGWTNAWSIVGGTI